jgi:light-harvesting complex 1 beta chain
VAVAPVALTRQPGRPAGDGRSFAGIFVAAFVVFLLIAVIAQSLAAPWRSWLPGAEGEKSLIGGVRSAVYTFMAHLS